MEKTIKINIPEGYIDCKFNSETNTIEFIKDSKPKTWEEYCEMLNLHQPNYRIHSLAGIIVEDKCRPKYSESNKCRFSTLEEANAFFALMQLRQLRKAWVDNWEPKYNDTNDIWHIHCLNNNIYISISRCISRPLSFPTEEMAQEFLDCFKDLIETAKILL